jgi:hypothetical protein
MNLDFSFNHRGTENTELTIVFPGRETRPPRLSGSRWRAGDGQGKVPPPSAAALGVFGQQLVFVWHTSVGPKNLPVGLGFFARSPFPDRAKTEMTSVASVPLW